MTQKIVQMIDIEFLTVLTDQGKIYSLKHGEHPDKDAREWFWQERPLPPLPVLDD